MKKTILTTVMITAAAGAALFAGGADEDTVVPGRGGRGTAMGFVGEDGVEIVSLEGTVEKDSYGNLMIDAGKTNYLLAPLPSMNLALEEGDVVDGEGVEGNTLYTKDGESYVNFHLTMATVDGEEYVIDMNRLGGPAGGRSGMTGGKQTVPGNMARGAMNRDDMARDDMSRGDMGRGGFALPEDGEETILSGTITLSEDEHPVLAVDGKSYLIRVGRMGHDLLSEGDSVEMSGYVSSETVYSEDGEDYYGVRITALTVNGEVIELDMPMQGGRGGMMGAKSMGRRG